MTDAPRDIRDILAEAMRRERLGTAARPAWADWWEEAREPVRMRADHLIRLLAEAGVDLVRTGEALPPAPPPKSLVVSRDAIVGRKAERIVRADPAGFAITLVQDGAETVEQTFTLQDASLLAGAVLTGSPEAAKRPGLGRLLAAAVEMYRLDAAPLEGKSS
jgi:hypothetical protein